MGDSDPTMKLNATRGTRAIVRISLIGLFTTALGGPPVRAQAPSPGATTTPVPRHDAAEALHRSFLERAREGRIDLLFLGDSITQGWSGNPIWKRHYQPRHAANFGIGGDRTQHVLWRIQNGELEGFEPRVVVLMIGTNNVGSDAPAEIALGIEAIVKEIRSRRSGAKILLLGVFPRGRTRNTELEFDEVDPRIDEINRRIEPLGKLPGVTYLDIGRRFLAPDGRIPRELMPDFLHLSRAGYRVWADAMEPTLWPLLDEAH